MFKDIAEALLTHAAAVRRVGRTTVTAAAARVIGATLVAATEHHAKDLRRAADVKVIPLAALDSERGSKDTLLYDHYAVEHLVRGLLNEAMDAERNYSTAHAIAVRRTEEADRARHEARELRAEVELLRRRLGAVLGVD